MSAVDPVDPPNIMTFGPATVIDISTRTTKTASQGRWKPVSTPQAADEGPESLARLADHIETTFNTDHLTLADDDTKAAYTITLGIVRGMLKGAHAKGVVNEEQLGTLDAMIEGMLSAPRLV